MRKNAEADGSEAVQRRVLSGWRKTARSVTLSAAMALALGMLAPDIAESQIPVPRPDESLRGATRPTPEPGTGRVTKLPIPRYASIRSDKVNVRRGPGLQYPKDWVFKRAGLPIRIVEEFGDWRRIVDSDGTGGWVYHALLTGRRTALVTERRIVLRDAPEESAAPVAELLMGVIVKVQKCGPDWCRLRIQDLEGWAPKGAFWGTD